jgi:hypothetical protein
MNILNIEKVSAEIKNFRECYEGVELWGERESFVSVENLIEFMIENPHFQEIAIKIDKLNREGK